MSKIIVYLLDKFVWMLIITVFTTQALQIAGIIETPKGLGEIEYTQDKEYEYGLSAGNGDVRGKRQAGDHTQLIDDVFNIPIATLEAVNKLVQSTRPAFQRLREVAQRRLETANAAAAANQAIMPIRRHRRPLSSYGRVRPNTSNSKLLADA